MVSRGVSILSFLEYVNKGVLKECGIKDFNLTEEDVKGLDYYRGNYISTHYIVLVSSITLLLIVILNVLILTNTVNFNLELISKVRNFLAIATINGILFRAYYNSRYKKLIEVISDEGLDKQRIKITPYNCIRYSKGKFIMLDSTTVDTLNAGTVNLSTIYKNSNDLLKVKLVKSKTEDVLKCSFTYEPLEKGMVMNLVVGEQYYKEFHELCLNGRTEK